MNSRKPTKVKRRQNVLEKERPKELNVKGRTDP